MSLRVLWDLQVACLVKRWTQRRASDDTPVGLTKSVNLRLVLPAKLIGKG